MGKWFKLEKKFELPLLENIYSIVHGNFPSKINLDYCRNAQPAFLFCAF